MTTNQQVVIDACRRIMICYDADRGWTSNMEGLYNALRIAVENEETARCYRDPPRNPVDVGNDANDRYEIVAGANDNVLLITWGPDSADDRLVKATTVDEAVRRFCQKERDRMQEAMKTVESAMTRVTRATVILLEQGLSGIRKDVQALAAAAEGT